MRYLFALYMALTLTPALSQADELADSKKNVEQIAKLEIDRIKSSNEVYMREFISIHSSIPVYCIDQCDCLSKHLRAILARQRPDLVTRIVLLNSNGVSRLVMTSLDLKREIPFDYHEAIEVSFTDGKYILDPILAGNEQINLLDERDWLKYFSNYRLSYVPLD